MNVPIQLVMTLDIAYHIKNVGFWAVLLKKQMKHFSSIEKQQMLTYNNQFVVQNYFDRNLKYPQMMCIC